MKRGQTKARILEISGRLFEERGYTGFSYQDISVPLGIRNAAVHYHYPTKEDLGVALIDQYRLVLRSTTQEFMEVGGNPVNQLDTYIQWIRNSYRQHGAICPMGILAVNYHTLPEAMKTRAQLLVNEMIQWLTRVLEAGRDAGLFFFNGPAVDKACAVKGLLQGAAQLARISGEGVLDSAVRQLRRDLGRE